MKVRHPNLEALYKEVDNYIPAKESLQPPRIGISANRRDGLSCIAETYVQAGTYPGDHGSESIDRTGFRTRRISYERGWRHQSALFA